MLPKYRRHRRAVSALTPGSNIGKTPWQGDLRINIQNDKGKAKAYQVRQVK